MGNLFEMPQNYVTMGQLFEMQQIYVTMSQLFEMQQIYVTMGKLFEIFDLINLLKIIYRTHRYSLLKLYVKFSAQGAFLE